MILILSPLAKGFIDGAEFCGWENKNCECAAGNTVWYGYGEKWTSKKLTTDNVKCSNSVFGDPKPGTRKMCYCQPAPVLDDWEDCECECKAKK